MSLYIYQYLFPLTADYYSITEIHHILFIHSSVDGHLHCSQFGAIANHVVFSIHVLVFVWGPIFVVVVCLFLSVS